MCDFSSLNRKHDAFPLRYRITTEWEWWGPKVPQNLRVSTANMTRLVKSAPEGMEAAKSQRLIYNKFWLCEASCSGFSLKRICPCQFNLNSRNPNGPFTCWGIHLLLTSLISDFLPECILLPTYLQIVYYSLFISCLFLKIFASHILLRLCFSVFLTKATKARKKCDLK